MEGDAIEGRGQFAAASVVRDRDRSRKFYWRESVPVEVHCNPPTRLRASQGQCLFKTLNCTDRYACVVESFCHKVEVETVTKTCFSTLEAHLFVASSEASRDKVTLNLYSNIFRRMASENPPPPIRLKHDATMEP